MVLAEEIYVTRAAAQAAGQYQYGGVFNEKARRGPTFVRSLALVCCVVIFLNPWNRVRASSADDVAAKGVEAYLRAEMQRSKIPGVQVAVVRGGRLVLLGAYGLANIENQIPVSNTTSFPINSMTKALTSVALMQLVEAGKLEIDAPVGRYLDGLPTHWRNRTIRQLATHMSGLPDIYSQVSNDIIVPNDPEASWAKVQTLPLEFAPGERVRYNQTNYLLLSRIIEKLSGERFQQYIIDHEIKVVGMPTTLRSGWADDRTVVMNKARTYTNLRPYHNTLVRSDVIHNAYYEMPSILFAAAGLESTAEEMAHWLVALEEGRLLKNKASITAMWTPGVLNDGTHGEYALGWPVCERELHPAVCPSGGARGAFAVYTNDDLAVFLFTNLNGSWPEELLDEVAAFYVPEMHLSSGFGVPEGMKAIHIELMHRGFDLEQAQKIIQEFRQRDSKFDPSPEDLRGWGLRVWQTGHRDWGFVVFKLATLLHPDDDQAFETLSAAYESQGDEDSAIDSHEHAQALKRQRSLRDSLNGAGPQRRLR